MHAHVLGFPRMGIDRELKWALEKYWRGEIAEAELTATADHLKKRHWTIQAEAGLDLVPVGDFSLYDHVLDTVAMLGAVPAALSPRRRRNGPDDVLPHGPGRCRKRRSGHGNDQMV